MNRELQVINEIAKFGFGGTGLYDYQKDLHWRLDNNPFNVILKSRQIGISFAWAGFTVMKAIKGETSGIVSSTQKGSRRVMQYIEQWLAKYQMVFDDIEIVEHNKEVLRIGDTGEVHSFPNSQAASRGFTFDRIFLDEYHHFLHGTDKMMWDAILPTLSRKSKRVKVRSVCVNSTPFGEQGLFHGMYTDRVLFPDFKPVFYHYSHCPDLDIGLIKRNMDSLSFQQEFEGVFVGDINTYYPYAITKPCIDQEMEYLTWEEMAALKVPLYAAADVGRRRDFSAIVILAYLNGRVRVVHKVVLKTLEEKEWDNQHKVFHRILQLPNMMKMYIDRGYGDELIDKLQKTHQIVQPFIFDNENKAEMHPMMRKAFESKEMVMPEDMELINCLHMIQRMQSGNNVKFDSDKRTDEYGHADLAVALVLAYYCYRKENQLTGKPKALEGIYRKPSGHQGITRAIEKSRRNRSRFSR